MLLRFERDFKHTVAKQSNKIYISCTNYYYFIYKCRNLKDMIWDFKPKVVFFFLKD